MSPRIHRVVGCYGWVSPRLSGLRLSKHTNRPPSLLLLRGTAWVYPSVERAGEGGGRGVGGGGEEGGKKREEIGEETTWTTTARPRRREKRGENGKWWKRDRGR